MKNINSANMSTRVIKIDKLFEICGGCGSGRYGDWFCFGGQDRR